ncbi:MAG TPA: hypothetical protein DD648_05180 [Candidatus Omnitrophica bacterium]|nr:hypothetical protein [Candidatus Omnitrophota bacterium]
MDKNNTAQVLLLNQYFTSKPDMSEGFMASMPLNMLYLASYLNSNGKNCKIYELGIFDYKDAFVDGDRIRFGISDEKIVEIIKKENPILVGVSCMYSRHYLDIIAIADLIKKVNPKIKIVTGGNHASIFSEMVLKNNSFDFVVRGEGEETLLELTRAVTRGEMDFSGIQGLAYKDRNERIIINKSRALIRNLDTLPLPDYSLLEVKKYSSLSYKSPYLMRYPSVGVMSSRGCPGNCKFCTVKAVWGRTWRGKSAGKVVDEIEILHKQYGIHEFSFLDDSAAINKRRWAAISDEIIKRKLDIKWSTPNGIAHWTLDKPLLVKMKKAGCYRITFGIESGNLKTREYIDKRHSLDQAKEMIRYANQIGMWTICTHILGFPYETREQIQDTVQFAKRSGTDFAAFFTLAPQPTSDVYNDFKKEGLLNFDDVLNSSEIDPAKYEEVYRLLNDGGSPTTHFTSAEIKKIHLEAYRDFLIYRALSFLNPYRILRKIRSVEDCRYALRLISTGVELVFKSFYVKSTKALLYRGSSLKSSS